MKKPTIVIGLDIGSSSISAVAAETGNLGSLNILAHATKQSKGVSSGIIVDMAESVDSVSKVLNKLRDKVLKLPRDVYVNINGKTLRGERARGMIALSLRGREVTRHDIARCVNVASTIQLPFEREILHKIVHNFSIDDQPWIKNPLSLYASRLTCEVYIVTVNINTLQNLYKTVCDAGYDIKEVVFSGIANATALLDHEQTEGSVLLLDIGEPLAHCSLFIGGTLNDFEIIPLEDPEDAKGNLGRESTLSDMANRCKEFLRKKNISKIGCVILTGALAFDEEVVEFLENKLPYPIKMGVVKNIRGDISPLDSMRLTTAIGLARYAQTKYNKQSLEDTGLIKRLSSKVVDIFNNYF